MVWWKLLIVGGAGLLAIQCLFSLMAQHRRAVLKRLIDEELRRRHSTAHNPPGN